MQENANTLLKFEEARQWLTNNPGSQDKGALAKHLLPNLKFSTFGAKPYAFDARETVGKFKVIGTKKNDWIDTPYLDMLIIEYYMIDSTKEILFNEKMKKYTQWVEVVFLDTNYNVSSIFLKMANIGRLQHRFREMEMSGMRPYDFWIRAVPEEREKPEPHFVLDFQMMKREERKKYDKKEQEKLESLLSGPIPEEWETLQESTDDIRTQVELMMAKNSPVSWVLESAPHYANRRIRILPREGVDLIDIVEE